MPGAPADAPAGRRRAARSAVGVGLVEEAGHGDRRRQPLPRRRLLRSREVRAAARRRARPRAPDHLRARRIVPAIASTGRTICGKPLARAWSMAACRLGEQRRARLAAQQPQPARAARAGAPPRGRAWPCDWSRKPSARRQREVPVAFVVGPQRRLRLGLERVHPGAAAARRTLTPSPPRPSARSCGAARPLPAGWSPGCWRRGGERRAARAGPVRARSPDR